MSSGSQSWKGKEKGKRKEWESETVSFLLFHCTDEIPDLCLAQYSGGKWVLVSLPVWMRSWPVLLIHTTGNVDGSKQEAEKESTAAPLCSLPPSNPKNCTGTVCCQHKSGMLSTTLQQHSLDLRCLRVPCCVHLNIPAGSFKAHLCPSVPA